VSGVKAARICQANKHPKRSEKMAETGGVAADQLRSYIERVERLEEEKAGIAADIRDIYAEAKANGFDVKALRQIVSMRKIEDDKRREHDLILATYMRALGMEE
jgi:uncharacterized protein (UPF0335 family)